MSGEDDESGDDSGGDDSGGDDSGGDFSAADFDAADDDLPTDAYASDDSPDPDASSEGEAESESGESDQDAAVIAATDDRDDVPLPVDTDAGVVEALDDRSNVPNDTELEDAGGTRDGSSKAEEADTDAGVIAADDDRSDVTSQPEPKDTDAAVVQASDERRDVPAEAEAKDTDAGVITATINRTDSKDADRPKSEQADPTGKAGDKTGETKGSPAKAPSSKAGGGGNGTVRPMQSTSKTSVSPQDAAIKAAKDFLAQLGLPKTTKTVTAKPITRPDIQSKTTSTGASPAARTPAPKPTPASRPSAEAKIESTPSNQKINPRQVGTRGSGPVRGSNQMSDETDQSSTVPPLWVKMFYGFFDEHDKWQQAGPLSWEEAGHQITAAMSLGRHCFLWDGGLRQWRPLTLDPGHASDVVHGKLAGAGWSDADRAAILRGPEHWRRHDQTQRGHAEDIVMTPPRRA